MHPIFYIVNLSFEKKVHHGRNVRRFRVSMNLKQDVLAAELGFTQQKMSDLEKKQVLKDEEIESIAKAIQLPAQAIKYLR